MKYSIEASFLALREAEYSLPAALAISRWMRPMAFLRVTGLRKSESSWSRREQTAESSATSEFGIYCAKAMSLPRYD